MIKIGLDMDGVLADLLSDWVRVYNNIYEDSLVSNDIVSWDFHNFVKPECGKKCYEILHSDFLNFANLDPIPGAVEAVANFMKDPEIDLYVVTDALSSPKIMREKYAWLRRHIPFLDRTKVFFAKHKEMIAVDVLIDDHTENVLNSYREGILFSAPHNKDSHLRKIENWKDPALQRYINIFKEKYND